MDALARPPFPHGYDSSILSLYYELRDGTIDGIGTGVIIAAWGNKGLGLTALHVAEHLSRLAATESNFKDLPTARTVNRRFESRVLTAHGARWHNGEIDQLNVLGFDMPTGDHVDLALARIDKRIGRHEIRHCLPIKPLPPEPGEQVMVTGFCGHQVVPDSDTNGMGGKNFFKQEAVTWPARVVAESDTIGTLRRGETFEVDVEFPPGLSGSPVLCARDNGYPFVCGIVSSSMQGSGRGTVSAIWPILAIPLRIGGPDASLQPLLTLMKDDVVDCYKPDLEHLQVGDFDGSTFAIRRFF